MDASFVPRSSLSLASLGLYLCVSSIFYLLTYFLNPKNQTKFYAERGTSEAFIILCSSFSHFSHLIRFIYLFLVHVRVFGGHTFACLEFEATVNTMSVISRMVYS